jgi:O-antigen ligase
VPYLTVLHTGVIGMALAGYLVVLLGADSRNARFAAAGLIAFGVGFAAVMIGQVALGYRPEGPFFNVNTAGALLNLLWPVAAALVLRPGLERRWFIAGALGVAFMGVAVGLTGGRAVSLALVAGLIALVVGSWHWAPRVRAAGVSASLLAGLGVAHLANWLFPTAEIRGLGHRLATLADPEGAGATRFPIWGATVEMIGERPLLGWGPGTFFQAYPAYRASEDRTAGFHVHNDYMQYWVEGGLPAFLLILALGIVSLWLFARLARRPEPASAPPVLGLAAAAAIAGAAVHACFSYNLQIPVYLILVGVALAALEIGSQAPGLIRLPLTSVRARPLPKLAFLLLVAVPVIHFGTVAASRYYYDKGVSLYLAGEFQPADQALKKADRYWGQSDMTPGLRAGVRKKALDELETGGAWSERRRTLKEQGFEMLATAMERNPLRSDHHRTRGRLHQQPPDATPEAAEASFRRALELDPRAAAARRDLGRLLRKRGRFEEALEVVNAGFGMFYTRNDPIPLMRLGIELREAAGNTEGADSLREQIRERRQRRAGTDADTNGVPP